MSVSQFPVSDDLGAQELLAAAAQRPFEQVMILGCYADGQVRYASTLSTAHQLHLLELYKMVLLGVAENTFVK